MHFYVNITSIRVLVPNNDLDGYDMLDDFLFGKYYLEQFCGKL